MLINATWLSDLSFDLVSRIETEGLVFLVVSQLMVGDFQENIVFESLINSVPFHDFHSSSF